MKTKTKTKDLQEKNVQEIDNLNLYQKIVEIRKAVPYLKKEASGHRYVYATESQILGAIREKMDELGLILYQDMESVERTSEGTLITFKYTWINAENPEEKLVCTQFMAEPGFDAKAFGAIMTYSNKYFLYKFLNVPTDKDDPDAFQDKVEARKPKPKLFFNESQIEAVQSLIEPYPLFKAHLLSSYEKETFGDFYQEQYDTVIQGISKTLSGGYSE